MEKIMNQILLSLIVLLSNTVFCQTPANINLNTADQGGKSYVATSEVLFSAGYSYAALTEFMEAKIGIQVTTPIYEPPFTSTTFNNASINTSLPVGLTSGSSSVSGSGGANYSLAIQVPSGTNGMIPSLSIVYNSQQGDGLLGVGWNISGISSISLTQTNWHLDNKVDNIKLNGLDKFALDGERLFATSGTYGANNTVYSTEVESYKKVISYGTGTTPQWFKVLTKEGLTYEYGNTSDSKIVNSSGQVIDWKVNKVTDSDGNYMVYQYTAENFTSQIDKISYTGNSNTGVLPYCYVKFKYQPRTDINIQYDANRTFKSNNLLTDIDIYSENTEHYKSYQLTYGQNFNSFLNSITEKGANYESLNSTIFKYGEKGLEFETLTCSSFAGISADFQAARDYNGDGKSDILAHHYNYDPNTGAKMYNKWEVFTSSTDNQFTHYAQGWIPSGYGLFLNGNRDHVNTQGMGTSIDFYGDGKDDVILYKISGHTNGVSLDMLTLVNITGIDQTTSENFNVDFGGYIHGDKFLQIGDYDGNGKDDIVILKNGGPTSLSYFGKMISDDYGTQNLFMNGLEYLTAESKVYSSDFDGDSRSEIFTKSGSTLKIFELISPAVNGSYGFQNIHTSNQPNTLGILVVWPGDFNGDGKTDLLTFTPSSNPYKLLVSNGVNFVDQNITFPATFKFDGDGILKIADLNGDGKSDIINSYAVWNGNVSTSSKIDVYYSKAVNFNYVSYLTGVISTFDDFVIGDFNGDGRSEIFNRDIYTAPSSIFYFNRNGQDRLLSGIKDGFRQTTKFNYSWLSKYVNYANGTSSNFPVNDAAQALVVVTSVENPNGVGGTSITNYSYQGAKWHRQGKGFLGFTKVTASNTTSGISTTQNFILNQYLVAPFYRTRQMVLADESVSLLSPSQIISKKTYGYTITDLGSLRYKIQLTNLVEDDLLNTMTSASSMSYDNFGNLLSSTIVKGDETTTKTNAFTTFGTWWIPSRMSSTTTTNTRVGQSAYTRQKNYSFGARGNLIQEISDPSTAKSVAVSYVYDQYGNITQTTTTSSGLPTVTEKIVYDDKGRFAISSINTLNQVTTLVNAHDKKWGKPLKVTDISGKTVTNTYNGFGELTSSTDPQGNVTTIQKYWDVTSGGATPTIPQNTIFYSQVNSTNKPYKKTWFDIFVREVKSELQTPNGATYSVVKFDSKGNNITSTSPFLVGGTAQIITTNTYDVYNRLLSVTNGINATSYAYSAIAGKLKTTVTNPIQTTSQTVDASGRIISSTDNGGTLNFTYFSNGEQKSIAMGSTILVQMEYDQYGRQTKLTDIDAGISTYVYNAYGQLITQTDANNVTYNLQYDVLGRETSKTGPDGVTSSTFIATGNGINQTRRITAANGSYFEYLYDDFGRVLSEIKFIDGQSFTTSTQYNIANNVSSITYPSGYKIKMNYSSIGDLISVTNDGGSLTMYSLPTTNEKGQITSYKLGNNKTTNVAYDAYGMLTTISATGVQNYEVLFSQSTGNLSFRKDYLKDKNELFWYDNLNRLTDCQVKSITTQLQGPIYTNTSYSPNGNITNKYNVGDYAYDANKIHAVKQINNPTVAIPSLVQAITYTPFDRTAKITEGTSSLTLKYGPDLDRIKSELYSNGNLVKTKYFIGGYEKEVTSTGTKEIHYIPTGNGSNAVYVIDQGVGSYFYLYKDHLGSVVAVTNSTGAVVYEQNFEAWGKRRDPLNWSNTSYVPNPSFSWVRGYTGHEHLDEFGLINMNNRMYDPVLGRMLAVDNFVQNPLFTQNYNRYSYAYNNPLILTDPTGESVIGAMVVGGVLGGVTGYRIAKNAGYEGVALAGVTFVGFCMGSVSGGIGAGISASAILGANTLGMMVSSVMYSSLAHGINTSLDVNMSFGVASYNITKNEFDYLGKKDNTKSQNFGYALGAMGNLGDILAGFNPGTGVLGTENDPNYDFFGNGSNRDPIGHSQYSEDLYNSMGEKTGSNILIDWGPDRTVGLTDRVPGVNNYENGKLVTNLRKSEFWDPIPIRGVNNKTMAIYGNKLAANKLGNYNLLTNSCVSSTSRSLNLSGVFNIGIFPGINHPYFLHSQMYLRSIGVRPMIFSSYLQY